MIIMAAGEEQGLVLNCLIVNVNRNRIHNHTGMQFVRQKLKRPITWSIFSQIVKSTPQNRISRRAPFNGQGPI